MTPVQLIPVALALLWGFNWPAVKIMLTEMAPFGARMVGLGVGAVLLLPVARLAGRSLAIARRDLWPLTVAGVLNIAGFNILTAFGQLNTTTSRAAILTFTTPLWAALLAYLCLGERLDRARMAALAIGLAGLCVLAVPLLEGRITLAGLMFPVLAGVAWAAGTVYQKARPIGGDRIAVTAYQLLIGAAVAGIGFVVSGESLPARPSAPVAFALAFHILGATAIAYLLWFIQLERLPAGAAAMTTFAIPVVGVLGAMALVGDRPSPLDWAGFAAILAAAAVVMFSGRAAAR